MGIIIFFALAGLTGYIIGYVVGHCLAEQEYEAKRAELEIDEEGDPLDELFK